MMKSAWIGLLISLFGVVSASAAEAPPRAGSADTNNWAFLDNGLVRIGVDKTAGGCIGFFGESASHRNLLNTFDFGRYIAQSYYGAPDGSLWDRQPWRWNPVQGGDWRRNAARLLDFEQSGTGIHARTLPKHWATGADIPEMTMEQHISLTGRTAHIRYRATYNGPTNHPPHHQELPAIYIDNALSNLVYYGGSNPWAGGQLTRRTPGTKNEYADLPENWAAYIDGSGRGVGIFTPGTSRMTCFYIPGPGGPDGSGCSYLAPIRTMAITNGLQFEYDVYMTIGQTDEMRETFRRLRN